MNTPTLTLPWPVMRALSPNFRGHWTQKYRAKAQLRESWAWEAKRQGAKRIDAEGLRLHITFVPPDKRHRDLDNLLASIKAGLDGLADVWKVDDSKWQLQISKASTIGGWVEVQVHEPIP